VRGPVSLAENVTVRADTYVGPYTSVGPDSTVANAHVENSVIVGDTEISASGRIVDSLVGRGASITSAEGKLPEGRRLVVGENSNISL
ncbi:glucose-1-phosphate thymidylyltransferase, partial [Halobium palmae]